MKVTTDACFFGAVVADKIESIAGSSQKENLLDIGAGTGLLSLMIAQKNPGLKIDTIEIDKQAARQAEENIAASPWKDTIQVINADIRAFEYKNKYDFIVSNPPFYENELKSGNERKNIAHHGEELSLTDLFSITGALLNDKGLFYFLLPYKRKEEVIGLLKDHSLFIHEIVSIRQSLQHDFFRLVITGGLHEMPQTEKDVSIRAGNEQYTTDFIDLLKDYYLHL